VCFPDFSRLWATKFKDLFYRYVAPLNSVELVKNRLHTMCWAIKRSQYIRSTPTRVTSLFIVGPSSETSPAEAATRMARHIQYVGLGDLVWFGLGWIWKIGLDCTVLDWAGLDLMRLEKQNLHSDATNKYSLDTTSVLLTCAQTWPCVKKSTPEVWVHVLQLP